MCAGEESERVGRSLNQQRGEPPPNVTGPSFFNQMCLLLLLNLLKMFPVWKMFLDLGSVWVCGVVFIFLVVVVTESSIVQQTCSCSAPNCLHFSCNLRTNTNFRPLWMFIEPVWPLTWLAVYRSVPPSSSLFSGWTRVSFFFWIDSLFPWWIVSL